MCMYPICRLRLNSDELFVWKRVQICLEVHVFQLDLGDAGGSLVTSFLADSEAIENVLATRRAPLIVLL